MTYRVLIHDPFPCCHMKEELLCNLKFKKCLFPSKLFKVKRQHQ